MSKNDEAGNEELDVLLAEQMEAGAVLLVAQEKAGAVLLVAQEEAGAVLLVAHDKAEALLLVAADKCRKDLAELVELPEGEGLARSDAAARTLLEAQAVAADALVALHRAKADALLASQEEAAGMLAARMKVLETRNAAIYAAEIEARAQTKAGLALTTAMLAAASELNKWTDVEHLLGRLAAISLAATAHSRVHVGLLADDRSHVTFAANIGANPTPCGTVVPWDQLSSKLREVLTTGRAQVVKFKYLPADRRGFADAADSRLALLVPIVFDDRVLGHIAVDDPGERREFSERDIQFIEGVAAQAAVALEKARLFESVVETARLNDALNIANRAIHSSLETDSVMQRALKTGLTALRCDAGTIQMIDHGGAWVVRYQSGFSADDVGQRLGEGESPGASRAAAARAPLAIEFLEGDDYTQSVFAKRYRLKSVLAVPLMVKDEVIGCALFCARESVKHFTEAEIDFGRKLASIVALGMENARLYEAEHNIAQVLQTALLTLPASISGIEFANSYSSATDMTDVGGDFYDIFELNDRHIGITIGDISGKGLKAAVLTSLVKNTIRAFASEAGKSPAQVLMQANDIVYRSTSAEVFATVFFAILDRRTGHIVYANAGHTTAAVMKDDGTYVRLKATGPLIGAFPAMEYADYEACLGLDELLFLYTDGLTEARRNGELYGEERLFVLLATTERRTSSEVVGALLADVTTFAGNRLKDDLAILAIRRSQLEGRC